MRIITGTLKGRIFDAPTGHRTHPMSDKMRGALFNMLGDLDGLTVLDAFAGSGALGFEAISRGATSVLAIDSDRSAQQTIAQNIKKLELWRRVKLVKASASAWLSTNPEATFNIVLCDPPYDDLQHATIQKLTAALAPKGIFVLSWPGKQPLPELSGVEFLETRNYGDAQLGFYQKSTT